jgi:hypothetical protein
MIRKSVKAAICIMAGALVMSSCRSVTRMSIQIEPEKPSVYTHPSLQKFIKRNKGVSVVVRDPNATSGGVSASGKTNELCGLIERALMKRDYNPRDRRLFESVAEKMKDMDYVALGEKTKTDLVFEVTDFSKEEYMVRNYWEYSDIVIPNTDPFILKGNIAKQKPLKTPRTFYGYSIEIKVVLLQDNLIGGTYKYFWTPCSQVDCRVNAEEMIQAELARLKGVGVGEAEAIELVEHMGIVPKFSQSITLNDFVSQIVIPSLFKDMGEGATE